MESPLQTTPVEITRSPHLMLGRATTVPEIRAVQRLRYRVFAGELGANISGGESGLDCDRFDAHCEHLLVRDSSSGEVVGTYRLLDYAQAKHSSGFYLESEFDLTALAPLLPGVLEVGRACVHPDYRRGAVIAMLWAGILQRVQTRGYSHVMGCASVPARDRHAAASVCRWLLQNHLGPTELQIYPWRAFGLEGWNQIPDAPVPALIKGYLRLGAFVCGAPAWDREFRTADVPLLLPADRINDRYVHRLLRAA